MQEYILAIGRDSEEFGQELPASLNSDLADLGGRGSLEVLYDDLRPCHGLKPVLDLALLRGGPTPIASKSTSLPTIPLDMNLIEGTRLERFLR